MIVQHAGIRIALLVCCLTLGPAACIAASQPTINSDPTDDTELSGDGTELDEVKHEWAQTVEALKAYTAVQRDAAVARAKQTLDAMDTRLEQLESRTQQEWDSLSQSARETREATLRTIRMQRNEAAEWYGGMKHGSAEAWESVKQGFIASYGTLNDAFGTAWSEFTEQETETQ